MQVEIAAPAHDDAHDQLTSLWQWLNDEDDLRGRVHRQAAPIPSGAMGGAADVLTVALASGGAITVLVGSVRTWLQSRRSTLTIKVRGPNSRSIEITAAGPAADVIAEWLAGQPDLGGAADDAG